MKLTIKNHDKIIGWKFSGPEKYLHWKITSVYERDDVYEFGVSLIDDVGNRIKGEMIKLSRISHKPAAIGEGPAYQFLPDSQFITPGWFTDLSNVETALRTEINTLSQKY